MTNRSYLKPGHGQRGMSMIFALLTIVALSLSAVALIRSVDSGSIVLGNLSFKRDTQLAADDVTRTAITWLSNNIASATLHNDLPEQGYYAQSYDTLDVPNARTTEANRRLIDWDLNDCAGATTPASCLDPYPSAGSGSRVLTLPNGVTARYVILRQCSGSGDPLTAAIACSKPLRTQASQASDKNSLSSIHPDHIESKVSQQYYRILVRARGARDTVTYTETVVHF